VKPVFVDRLLGTGATPPADPGPAELAALIAGLGRPDWRLELAWVEDAEMTALNGRWRGREVVTDVLSFSNLVDRGEGEPVLPCGVGGAAADLWWEDGPEPPGLFAGEIVIAPDFVTRRCAAEGWDLADEFALLVVHGALHVLGWAHDTADRTLAMRKLEGVFLADGGRGHPLLDGADPTAP